MTVIKSIREMLIGVIIEAERQDNEHSLFYIREIEPTFLIKLKQKTNLDLTQTLQRQLSHMNMLSEKD